MDAPRPEDVRPFLRIGTHLAGLGLSVPAIIAADPENGLVIEEDLGDGLFSAILGGIVTLAGSPSSPDRPGLGEADAAVSPATQSLLTAAVDALVIIQRAAPPKGLPVWDGSEMTETALGTFCDWWWPAMHGRPAPDAVRVETAAALASMLTSFDHGPRGMVHRDFFAGNLLWLPGRKGVRRAGVIDFQSAAIGHPAYDLVSLLQDARQDIPTAWADFAICHYLDARPELDPAAFRLAYAAYAAQRHLRVACQWVRLAKRDNRPRYLAYGPRTWRLLTCALAQKGAAPLADVLNRFVPEEDRRNPPGLTTT